MANPRIDGIPEDQLDSLPPYQREMLGLPPVPQSGLRSVLETSFLGKYQIVRRLFGLDRIYTIDPPSSIADETSGGVADAWSWYRNLTYFDSDRTSVYRLLEEMSQYDIIGSALDLYAEEATQVDPDTGLSVWIEASSAQVKNELERMLERIGMEENIFGIARTTAMYGDAFEQPIIDRNAGIVAMRSIYSGKLTRVEDKTGVLRGFAPGMYTIEQMLDDEFMLKLNRSQPWDFINFQIRSSKRELRCGESLLMNARYCWRQLKILEDSLVLYRVNRAPNRLVYKIDVTGLAVDEQLRALDRYRKYMRKRFMLNAETGTFRQEYRPHGILDDLYVPVQKDSAGGIDMLAGSANTDDIADVTHFRNKLFGSLRIPKGFMGFEGDISWKTALAQQDIRFARTVKRLRRACIRGVAQTCRLHLALRGIDPGDSKNTFTVRMAPITILEELQRGEIVSLRLEQVERLLDLTDKMQLEGRDNVEWKRFVLADYLGLTEDQIARFLSRQISGQQVVGAGAGGGGGGGSSFSPPIGDELPGDQQLGDQPAGDADAEPLPPEEGDAGADTEEPADDEDDEKPLDTSSLSRTGLAKSLLEAALRNRQPPTIDSRFVARASTLERWFEDGSTTIQDAGVYDLNEEWRKLEEVTRQKLQRVDGSKCPNGACEGRLRLVTSKNEAKGVTRRCALCSTCGFAAEVEGIPVLEEPKPRDRE